MTTQRRTIRCAIYTRKSSEEGLEQGFNSLEAQREACAAYIKSQAHEGWKALPERYDDGGHSGGTLERPAVQQLLEQVKARKLDIIVIYKIDRLTRSLTDFARLAELFDQHGVSFVSVTQQFNTTTSMGRLMLNVLLSFAQFEREITGERIRDKVAASKRKGIWMGGFVPLGYEVKNRALIVVPEEAETVRTIFRLYLKLGTVWALKRELDRRGFRTKRRQGVPGRWQGGRPFWPGHLYNLLGNPIYIGKLKHKELVHQAAHEPIIDAATWNAVQQQLDGNRQGERRRGRPPVTPSLLTGLLFDPEGNRFGPSYCNSDGRKYRYYVDLTRKPDSKRGARRRRVPAEEIERVVADAIAEFLGKASAVQEAIGEELPAGRLAAVLDAARRTRSDILKETPIAASHSLRPLIDRVVLTESEVRIAIECDRLRHLLDPGAPPQPSPARDGLEQDARTHELRVGARVAMSGLRQKLVVTDGSVSRQISAPTIVKAIARGYLWFEMLRTQKVQSVADIARGEGLTEAYVSRMLRLALLAPPAVDSALRGGMVLGSVTIEPLLERELPWIWSLQRP
ncbi:MAG: recombinase family protein [Rhodospirillales bacterium]|nr:recombinase family protein [Rhodospirillales bacterium]